MANYQSVSTLFWKDRKARKWSDAERSLALYLLTGPHANTEGLYWLPLDYVCVDLGWTPKKAGDAFDGLARDGFCQRDEETETVLIVKALKYRTPSGEPQLKGAVAKVSEVPPTPLFAIFRDSAETHAPELIPYLDKESDGTLSGHYRYPLDTPSDGYLPSADTPSNTQEQTRSRSQALARTQPSSPSGDDGFEDFWSAYPRRDGKPGGGGDKKPTRQKWQRLPPEHRAAAMAALPNYRAYVERPDTQHPKHALTWLNKEAWESWHEPATPPSRAGPSHARDMAAMYGAAADEAERRGQ